MQSCMREGDGACGGVGGDLAPCSRCENSGEVKKQKAVDEGSACLKQGGANVRRTCGDDNEAVKHKTSTSYSH